MWTGFLTAPCATPDHLSDNAAQGRDQRNVSRRVNVCSDESGPTGAIDRMLCVDVSAILWSHGVRLCSLRECTADASARVHACGKPVERLHVITHWLDALAWSALACSDWACITVDRWTGRPAAWTVQTLACIAELKQPL